MLVVERDDIMFFKNHDIDEFINQCNQMYPLKNKENNFTTELLLLVRSYLTNS